MPDRPRRSRPRIPGSPPRLGHIREFFEAQASEAVRENLASVAERFRSTGAEVVELPLPPSFAFVIPAWDIIKQAELYAYHRPLFERRGADYPPKLRARLEKGRAILGHECAEHLQHRIVFQREMAACMAEVDAVFMPVASGTAPRGLSSTGSSYFNRPWTVSGFPAMSLPTGLDRQGLPLALQLAAQPYAEAQLLEVAAWCESVLSFDSSPDRAGAPVAGS
jgi:aspartyl-tRNA(Asn)/glutamyl-tRNA(Gln) amidotransferase subunit A